MKGIVFSNFLELVDTAFGAKMVDDLIESCNLTSSGAYITVGTYDHEELVNMVSVLSGKTNIPVPELIKTFGTPLTKVFSEKVASFFEEVDFTIEFLIQSIDHIHVEVRNI